MSKPSSDLYLDYRSQKSHENPYKKFIREKDSDNGAYFTKKHRKKKLVYLEHRMFSNMYNADNLHSHLIVILSVICMCIFYTAILRVKHTFIVDKYYHSLCLGFICLIDYLINKEKYQINFREEFYNENHNEYNTESEFENENELHKPLLLNVAEGNKAIADDENKLKIEISHEILKKRDLIIYCISLGVISFATEMLTFYLLKVTTDVFEKNSGIGFALISFEFIFIRFYFSMEDVRIEFLNFSGLLMIFATFLFISIEYLSLPLGGVAFFISSLRFSKFFLQVQLIHYSNLENQLIILYANLVDFLIGCVCLFSEILFNRISFFINFEDVILILIASLCYYINGKYFRYNDRYCLSISSVFYPCLILFDYLINNRGMNLFEIILILFLSVQIAMTFIGDKIWNEDDFFNEIHHREHHRYHNKNGRTYRQDSNLSETSIENKNEISGENVKDSKENLLKEEETSNQIENDKDERINIERDKEVNI